MACGRKSPWKLEIGRTELPHSICCLCLSGPGCRGAALQGQHTLGHWLFVVMGGTQFPAGSQELGLPGGQRGGRKSRSIGIQVLVAVSVAPRPADREAKQGCTEGRRARERLSQLVLKTLGELKRTAWSQTLGKAAEKRMPARRVCEEMVKEHSYPYK